jgi:hypothetical protein
VTMCDLSRKIPPSNPCSKLRARSTERVLGDGTGGSEALPPPLDAREGTPRPEVARPHLCELIPGTPAEGSDFLALLFACPATWPPSPCPSLRGTVKGHEEDVTDGSPGSSHSLPVTSSLCKMVRFFLLFI